VATSPPTTGPGQPPAAGQPPPGRPPAGQAARPASATRRPPWLRLPRQTLLRHGLLAVAAGLGIYFLSIHTSTFAQIRIASVGYTVIAVAGLTVLVGLNGQLSLGHGALMAVGGYTVAELTRHAGSAPLWLDLLAAVALTAAVGAVTGVAAARLRGPYLAGATLALAVGVPDLARQYLGGDSGIVLPLTTSPAALPDLAPERWQAWFCWLAALITLVLLANLVRSRLGRQWRAARDDEVAAALAGIRVARVQVLAFVVSAGCAGLAGGLLAVVVGSAGPGSFSLTLSVGLLAAAILGGLGSLTGALWGAVLLVYLPFWSTDAADRFALPDRVANNLPLALYGAVLIAVMLLAPAGIQGTLRRLAGRAAARRTYRPARRGTAGRAPTPPAEGTAP
jgi:branched-chain amino acid transport system permease protein